MAMLIPTLMGVVFSFVLRLAGIPSWLFLFLFFVQLSFGPDNKQQFNT